MTLLLETVSRAKRRGEWERMTEIEREDGANETETFNYMDERMVTRARQRNDPLCRVGKREGIVYIIRDEIGVKET